MKAFHDSRDNEYRSPYGAVTPGTPVTLAIDVFCERAAVTLRTWVEGVGERLYSMEIDEAARCAADATRFQTTITPDNEGIVWYSFIIADEQGNAQRYGAQPGRLGGEGALSDWEPPSFQLMVHEPRDLAPSWNEMVAAYLHNDPPFAMDETVETIRENYPVSAYATCIPWQGEPSWFAENDDVFGFRQHDDAGYELRALVNTSIRNAHDLDVPLGSNEVSELIGGYSVHTVEKSGERFARVHLNPCQAVLLHLHPQQRLQRPMEPGVGVLAHFTSLPSDDADGGRMPSAPGTLGVQARRFVDHLAQAGVRYWQVLPANPTDAFGSPYAGISAYAGNPNLIEGISFEEDGTPILPEEVDENGAEYRAFCERESHWLEPYAAFMAIRQTIGKGMMWQEWPDPYRRFDMDVIEGDVELKRCAAAWKRSQFVFERQWNELRSYANEKKVQIVGDMPIYVCSDSADVWAYPGIFQLGADGMPALVAGCPPDAFAVDGQIWGNPVYDWDACKASDYQWWMQRLQRAFELYDWVRLDHFIGFSRYFSIPAGEKATAGQFHHGPGYAFFRRAYEEFGPLPVIAEDLGLITPAVRDLSTSCGFPGMDIMQFADGNDPLSGYQPRPDKIPYTGTHDNQTLAGYCAERYPQLPAAEAAGQLAEALVTCDAPVCILPLQDLLGLGDEARMNIPGTADGNWRWQATPAQVEQAVPQMKRLAELHRSSYEERNRKA